MTTQAATDKINAIERLALNLQTICEDNGAACEISPRCNPDTGATYRLSVTAELRDGIGDYNQNANPLILADVPDHVAMILTNMADSLTRSAQAIRERYPTA